MLLDAVECVDAVGDGCELSVAVTGGDAVADGTRLVLRLRSVL
jgi:hypothetical protein